MSKNRPRKVFTEIYSSLMDMYGQQGWWPIISFKGEKPTKHGGMTGYHPGDYSIPKNSRQCYEICVGAILTQNTSWANVEKAIVQIDTKTRCDPLRFLALDDKSLKESIRPAGYFNQKAKKLRIFTEWFLKNTGTPSRAELLSLWGIGKETADSMLLYAYNVPTFVVDAYTRRLFGNLGIINSKSEYDDIKRIFEESITPDLTIYQEYHALIVEHAKNYYSGKKEKYECPLCERFKK